MAATFHPGTISLANPTGLCDFPHHLRWISDHFSKRAANFKAMTDAYHLSVPNFALQSSARHSAFFLVVNQQAVDDTAHLHTKSGSPGTRSPMRCSSVIW
jgi:hypothetical protein